MERIVTALEADPKSPFEIRESSISGSGCFATKAIHKGDMIRTLVGEAVSGFELDKRITSGELILGMDLQIKDDSFLLLDSPDIYFNHSCEPNAGIRGENELFAIKDISEGEEITFDYSTTIGINREPSWLFDNDDWTMQCNCDGEACRGMIGPASSIPEASLRAYFEAGALPNFIRNQLGRSFTRPLAVAA